MNDAVVMAAGEGVRLRPLTERYAKPVLPLDGRPVIATLLRELQAAGVERAWIVLRHRGEQIRALLGDGSGFGLELRYAEQRRDHRPSVQRQHRLGVALGQRTQAHAFAGRHHDGVVHPDRKPSERRERSPRMRSRVARRRRIRALSRRSSRRALRAARPDWAGGP